LKYSCGSLIGWYGNMPLLAKFVRYEVMFLLGGLAAVIGAQLLGGEINTKGLLFGSDSNGNRSLSPGRIQLLLLTMAAAGQYLTQVLGNLGNLNQNSLPPVNNELVAGLLGSNAVYLTGKFYNIFVRDVLGVRNGRGK
jgi:hypothetical protein